MKNTQVSKEYNFRVDGIASSFVSDGYRDRAYEDYSLQAYLEEVKHCIIDYSDITKGCIKFIDIDPIDVIREIPKYELWFGVYRNIYGNE